MSQLSDGEDRGLPDERPITVSGGSLLTSIAGLGLIAAALAMGIWLGRGGAAQEADVPAADAAAGRAPSVGAVVVEDSMRPPPTEPYATSGSALDLDSASMPDAAFETAPAVKAAPTVVEDLYIPTGAATDAEGLLAAEEGRIGQPTLVFFHADWCHVCQEIAPEMAEIQAEYAETVAFVKMNIDDAEGRPASQRYRVRGTPTFVMFDAAGRRIQQFSGWPGRMQMTALMDSVAALQ